MHLPWSPDALDRLERIPVEFVRKRILTRVEEYARERGLEEVTMEAFEAGEGSFAPDGFSL